MDQNGQQDCVVCMKPVRGETMNLVISAVEDRLYVGRPMGPIAGAVVLNYHGAHFPKGLMRKLLNSRRGVAKTTERFGKDFAESEEADALR